MCTSCDLCVTSASKLLVVPRPYSRPYSPQPAMCIGAPFTRRARRLHLSLLALELLPEMPSDP